MDETTTRRWQSLPGDLLASIAKRLSARSDVASFRAVCNAFRSSVPSPPKLSSPYLSLKLPVPDLLKTFLPGHFLLTQSTVYAIQPLSKISLAYETTKTWMVRIEESNSGKVKVKDPLCGNSFKNLSDRLPKSLNLLDYRVEEVARAYGLQFVPDDCISNAAGVDRWGKYFIKAVVCPSLEEIDNGLSVMVMHSSANVMVWRNGEDNWTYVEIDRVGVFFQDIICHNQKFYAVDISGLTIIVDPVSLNITEIATPMDLDLFEKYLVSWSNDLFLVVQPSLYIGLGEFGIEEDLDGEDIPVFLFLLKLDEEKREWVQVINGMEDKAMFLGRDCSFCVLAKEFPGCLRNCFYFPDFAIGEGSHDHPGVNAGIFDLEDRTSGSLSSLQGYSKIFWPPPAWLK